MSDYYFHKSYLKSVSDYTDTLRLCKNPGSHVCILIISRDEKSIGQLTIGSLEMAEHLHFMLGQMLDKPKP